MRKSASGLKDIAGLRNVKGGINNIQCHKSE